MNLHSRWRPRRANEGFTLVELLVYMLVLTVVLAIVGGILINTVQGQRDIRGRAEAATLGQVAITSVRVGVRNASFVELTSAPTGQLLRARSAGNGTDLDWSCRAWYYTPADGGTLFTKQTSPPSAIAAPTAATLSTWVQLGKGISVTGANIFSAVAGRVTIELDVDTGKGAPIAVNSVATMRTLPTTISPC